MAVNPACQTFIPMLSPFVDGELPPQERVTVERHLAVCRDCSGRVVDLRAESGLIRHGLDLAADEVDFRDFAQQVMARLTPYKPPLMERLRVSLSEMFLYQRTAMVSSLVTAAVVLFVAVPAFMLWTPTPEGYASQQMAVNSVTTETGAKVTPVVMTNDHGDAIIWMVSSEQPASEEPNTSSEPSNAQDQTQPQTQDDAAKKLNQTKPNGGEL